MYAEEIILVCKLFFSNLVLRIYWNCKKALLKLTWAVIKWTAEVQVMMEIHKYNKLGTKFYNI